MLERERSQGRWARLIAGLVVCGVLLGLLAGCSVGGGSDSGSSKLSLGLAGSTTDHPAQPPTLASGGPAGTFAFVYDNQIWLRQSGSSSATQLTHLVLSTGANITWGPLVWSQSGRYIAFALVQNLTPTSPGGTSGPIYYVDTHGGQVYDTGATGSIYGHSFAWFGDSMLFYTSGGGIMMFGPLNVPNADPRTWQALTQIQGNGEVYGSGGVTYGDLAIGKGNGDLFYSQISITSPGSTGTVGNAQVYKTGLPSLDSFENVAQSDQTNNTDRLPYWVSQNITLSTGRQVADLGAAYVNAAGSVVTGAWNISPDENILIAQNITRVDTKGGTVSSSFCETTGPGYYGCNAILDSASKAPLSAYLSLGISPDDSHVAYTSDALYIASVSGSGVSKLASAGWTTPPAWSSNNKTVAATQLASTSTDASGVVHNVTNIQAYSGGSSSLKFVSGGQDPSWYYG